MKNDKQKQIDKTLARIYAGAVTSNDSTFRYFLDKNGNVISKSVAVGSAPDDYKLTRTNIKEIRTPGGDYSTTWLLEDKYFIPYAILDENGDVWSIKYVKDTISDIEYHDKLDLNNISSEKLYSNVESILGCGFYYRSTENSGKYNYAYIISFTLLFKDGTIVDYRKYFDNNVTPYKNTEDVIELAANVKLPK